MNETIPMFKTDEEAERFVETADLSQYDLSGQFVKFEPTRKDADEPVNHRGEEVKRSNYSDS